MRHDWNHDGREQKSDGQIQRPLEEFGPRAKQLLLDFQANNATDFLGGDSETCHANQIRNYEEMAEALPITIKEVEQFVAGETSHANDAVGNFVLSGYFEATGKRTGNYAIDGVDFGRIVIQDSVGL